MIVDEDFAMTSPPQVSAAPVAPPPAAPVQPATVEGVPPELGKLMEQWDV